jgi:hypothetical protein
MQIDPKNIFFDCSICSKQTLRQDDYYCRKCYRKICPGCSKKLNQGFFTLDDWREYEHDEKICAVCDKLLRDKYVNILSKIFQDAENKLTELENCFNEECIKTSGLLTSPLNDV